MTRVHSRARRGISLVEVMVVIAILMVLMTVLALGVQRAWKSSQVNITLLTMQKVDGDLMVHEARHGSFPTEAEGLRAVYDPDEIPRDAWSTELQYELDRKPDLISLGDDRAAGGTGWAADIRYSERRRR